MIELINQKIVKYIILILQNKNRKWSNKIIWRIVCYFYSDKFIKTYYSFNSKKQINWENHRACLTLSFDCDRENDYKAIPSLLQKLEKSDIRASFACIGKWIEKIPHIHKKIIENGHEIINHTYTHPSNIHFHPGERFNQLSYDERKNEIVMADNIIKNMLAYNPAGFRTPHFGDSHTEDVYDIIKKIGYSYSSSMIAIQSPNYGMPYQVRKRLWEFPLSIDPKKIITCFDTYNYFKKETKHYSSKYKREKYFFKQLIRTIEIGMDTNSYINLYFDPEDSLILKWFPEFIDYLKGLMNDLWITTYRNILNII